MDLNDINKWVTLAANIGVVAGIILLVFEIRQNNDLLAAQSRMIGEENRMRSEMAIMSNAALREVLIKKNQEVETTPQEELLFLVFQSTEINSWHATWLEYQADLIDIEGYIERWRDLYKYQGYSERWNSTKHRYSPGFVTWMEENVVNH